MCSIELVGHRPEKPRKSYDFAAFCFSARVLALIPTQVYFFFPNSKPAHALHVEGVHSGSVAVVARLPNQGAVAGSNGQR